MMRSRCEMMKRVGGVQKSANVVLGYPLKGNVKLTRAGRIQNQQAHTPNLGCGVDFFCFSGSWHCED
jgi:hypothetical protein